MRSFLVFVETERVKGTLYIQAMLYTSLNCTNYELGKALLASVTK